MPACSLLSRRSEFGLSIYRNFPASLVANAAHAFITVYSKHPVEAGPS
jgi:hypothetical protein